MAEQRNEHLFEGSPPPRLPRAEPPPLPEPDVDPLGPFAPPEDFAFEPELTSPTPRPIPALLSEGRYAQGKRKVAWGFLLTGLILTAAAFLPVTQTIALYFLPLRYVVWIGLGCLAIGAGMFVANRSMGGPYRYVIEGVPLPARVRDLQLIPTVVVNGQTTTYQYVAMVDFREPATGEVKTVQLNSNDVSAGAKDGLTTSFRVGDYVTAVYLPSEPASSLRLYGFLDLRPGVGVVNRSGAPPTGVLAVLGVISAIALIFGVLIGMLYVFGRFAPLEMSLYGGLPAFLVGSVGLGVPILAWIVISHRRRRLELIRKNQEAVAAGEAVELEARDPNSWSFGELFLGLILLVGILGLSGAASLGVAVAANAILDDSPPDLRPVRVRLLHVTHNFIIREYKIEYRFINEPDRKHSMMTTPDHLQRFTVDVGVAAVHRGRFGWPWVRTIEPFQPPPRAPGPEGIE